MKNTNENLNTIVNAQAEEVKAAEEARKAAADKAAIDSAQPKTILNMIDEVKNGTLLIITDDNDNIVGINCPKAVKGIAATQKIGGHMVMGADEANMHEDYLELQKFIKSYSGQNIMHMFGVALKASKINGTIIYAEEINGIYYLAVKEWKKVIDEDGNTVVDVNDLISGDVDSKLLTTILVDKLHLYINDIADYEDEDEDEDEDSDYDDDDYDDDDYDEDEEDDEE